MSNAAFANAWAACLWHAHFDHNGPLPSHSQHRACRDMIKRTQDDFNGLDILVNNVGIQFVSPVQDFPEEKWDAIMDVCLNSAFHSTKAALPYMLEQKWGRIINTGSMHALVASPYKSAYNAAKHGIAGFTKTVGLEVAQKGNITCNCICPGYVLTDLIKNQLKDTAKARGIPEVMHLDVITFVYYYTIAWKMMVFVYVW